MTDWCALFDWDGVVIDSSLLHQKSWERLASSEGLRLPDGYFKKAFGMKNDRIIPEILGWAHEVGAVRELARRKELLYRALVAEEGIQALPGVESFLQQLREQQVPAIVASSSSRANIDCALAQIGLRHYFKDIVSGDQVEHGKPHPGIFLLACRTLGYAPERAVVFEDALVGLEAARAAGTKVVAVTTTHVREHLLHADLVVDRLDEIDVKDLSEWFEQAELV